MVHCNIRVLYYRIKHSNIQIRNNDIKPIIAKLNNPNIVAQLIIQFKIMGEKKKQNKKTKSVDSCPS